MLSRIIVECKKNRSESVYLLAKGRYKPHNIRYHFISISLKLNESFSFSFLLQFNFIVQIRFGMYTRTRALKKIYKRKLLQRVASFILNIKPKKISIRKQHASDIFKATLTD